MAADKDPIAGGLHRYESVFGPRARYARNQTCCSLPGAHTPVAGTAATRGDGTLENPMGDLIGYRVRIDAVAFEQLAEWHCISPFSL